MSVPRWRPARPQAIVGQSFPEGASRSQALVSKQVDLDVGPSFDLLEQIEKAGGKLFIYPAPCTLGLSIVSVRNTQPVPDPWGDVRVRQAATYAVNKQTLVEAALKEFYPAKRQAMFRELLAINGKNAPIIFLTEGIEVIGYAGRIKNFKAVNLVVNYHTMELNR